MLTFNIHTHTKRCGHAVKEDEDYVLSAINAGITVLGFSDHAPYKQPNPSIRMNYEQLDEYITSINHLKEKYKNQITIFLGIEYEYFPSQLSDTLRYRQLFDYCILGQHGSDIDGIDYFFITKPNEVIQYAKQVEYAMSKGLVDVVCHPDVFMFSYPTWDKACTEAATIIAKASLQYDVPLELNCGGVRYGKREYPNGKRYAYPYLEFWKIIQQHHCKIIVGLDYHNPDLFTKNIFYYETLEVVQSLNLTILDKIDIIALANRNKEIAKKAFNHDV